MKKVATIKPDHDKQKFPEKAADAVQLIAKRLGNSAFPAFAELYTRAKWQAFDTALKQAGANNGG